VGLEFIAPLNYECSSKFF